MKQKLNLLLALGILAITISLAVPAAAFEFITRTDIIQKVIVKEDLIKTADNAIFLFDASGSMDRPYKDSGLTRYEIAKKILKKRNEYFPEMGHNMGFYLYTPWTELLPVQTYNRNAFAQALEKLPEKPERATLMVEGLTKLDGVLKDLTGKTVVFLFTDGTYSITGKRKPFEIAQSLARRYNVCFHLISTNDDKESAELFKRVKDFNFCSRVIALSDFVENPSFNSEALFTVKATRDIVTVTDSKIVGFKPQNILFDFDSDVVSQDIKDKLPLLADYLNQNPDTMALMAGHTDSTGPDEYNMELSYRRVERVKDILVRDHGVDRSRLGLFWFGKLNPVADNSTIEGRRLNRRVEIVVGTR